MLLASHSPVDSRARAASAELLFQVVLATLSQTTKHGAGTPENCISKEIDK